MTGGAHGKRPMGEWLALALRGSVVRRALGYAVVVGAILITINHGDALLAGDIDTRRILKMALTVTVPYLVSTLSSVGAMRSLRGRLPSCRRPGAGRGGGPVAVHGQALTGTFFRGCGSSPRSAGAADRGGSSGAARRARSIRTPPESPGGPRRGSAPGGRGRCCG